MSTYDIIWKFKNVVILKRSHENTNWTSFLKITTHELFHQYFAHQDKNWISQSYTQWCIHCILQSFFSPLLIVEVFLHFFVGELWGCRLAVPFGWVPISHTATVNMKKSHFRIFTVAKYSYKNVVKALNDWCLNLFMFLLRSSLDQHVTLSLPHGLTN